MGDDSLTKNLSWSGFRWMGVTILLLGYLLVSQGYLDGKGIAFNIINSIGSILLIANSLSLKPKDWAVAVFNIVWLSISVFTIFKVLFF